MRSLSTVSALLFVATGVGGCRDEGKAPAGAEAPAIAPGAAPSAGPMAVSGAEASSIAFRWVAAQPPRGVSLLEAPAEVQSMPGTVAAVSLPFAGRVVELHVAAGQRVARGAPVVSVVMPAVLSAAGAHVGASTRLSAFRARREQLAVLKEEGLVRTAEVAEAEARVAEASSDRAVALATLKGAGLSADDAGRLLSSDGAVVLRSPLSGVVVSVGAVLGEARAPEGEPIVRVAAEGATRLVARLPQGGTAAQEFAFVSGLGAAVALQLVELSPVADPTDGTRVAWLEPVDSQVRLRAGTRGRVQLGSGSASDAAVVPLAAVRLSETGAVVWGRRGESPPSWLPVKVLSTSGSDALVSGGVMVGDRVASDASRVETAAVPP